MGLFVIVDGRDRVTIFIYIPNLMHILFKLFSLHLIFDG